MIRNAHFLIISPGLPYHYNRAFSNIRSLKYRRKKHGYKFFYSDVSNTAHKLHHLLPPKGIQRYNLSPASTHLCCQKFALVDDVIFFLNFLKVLMHFPLKFSGICLKIRLRICHKTSLATKQISKSCKSTIKTLQNKNSHDKESGSHPKHVRVTKISQFLS